MRGQTTNASLMITCCLLLGARIAGQAATRCRQEVFYPVLSLRLHAALVSGYFRLALGRAHEGPGRRVYLSYFHSACAHACASVYFCGMRTLSHARGRPPP